MRNVWFCFTAFESVLVSCVLAFGVPSSKRGLVFSHQKHPKHINYTYIHTYILVCMYEKKVEGFWVLVTCL